MKISRINNSQIYFTAGKTSIYSDFDGSYMPFTHNDVCNNGRVVSDEIMKTLFNDIYTKFAIFLAKGKDDIDFTITTGRSKNEYDYFISRIKEQGLSYVSPQKLLTRDGNDFYYINSDKYTINTERQKKISQTANWDGTRIKNDLKTMLKQYNGNICIIDAPINKCSYDYGDLSLEHQLCKVSDKDKRFYVSFAQNDIFFIDIAFSKQLDAKNIKFMIENYMQNNGIQADVRLYEQERHTYLPQYTSNNKLGMEPGMIIRMSPKIDNHIITKFDDIKKEVEYNVKNQTDNLVIAIGDSINDETMLNPINYLAIYGFNDNLTATNIFNNPNALNLLRKLPFAAIIVGNNKSLEHLRQLGIDLEKHGIKKIFLVNEPQKGFIIEIKKAIYSYGEENINYKYSMNMELFQEMLEGSSI